VRYVAFATIKPCSDGFRRGPKDRVLLLSEIVGIRRRSGKSEVKKTDHSGSGPFVDAPSDRI
jgi:hypothetical protein